MNHPTHLLLVEDNLGDVGLVQAALQAGDDHDVQLCAVHNAHEALRFVAKTGPYTQAQRPDLIVLDLSLPDMTGIALLASLKRNDSWRDIPVMILTASQRPDERKACLAGGAAAYWHKPVVWADFTAFAADLRRCLTTGGFAETKMKAGSAA